MQELSNKGLVYTGKIISLELIKGADFICLATVICGKGGKWRGVVLKSEFDVGSLCTVFLQDSILPQTLDFEFMAKHNWHVKMCRFKGAPSEVIITPLKVISEIGVDVTDILGVTKYYKPIPSNLQGIAKGDFPSFIPKTDELNYQSHPELVDQLVGKFYYISEKLDGSSTTAYRYNGNFGVCSRNLELEKNEENGFWKVVKKYKLEENLPEGYALQWETCGPGIQGNPMGLPEIDGFAFSAFNINEKRYLEMMEFYTLLDKLNFPDCGHVDQGNFFSKEGVENLGSGFYDNGKPREGVVVRSQHNYLGYAPISFKVINLDYES